MPGFAEVYSTVSFRCLLRSDLQGVCSAGTASSGLTGFTMRGVYERFDAVDAVAGAKYREIINEELTVWEEGDTAFRPFAEGRGRGESEEPVSPSLYSDECDSDGSEQAGEKRKEPPSSTASQKADMMRAAHEKKRKASAEISGSVAKKCPACGRTVTILPHQKRIRCSGFYASPTCGIMKTYGAWMQEVDA